jgi:hypothetical protein
MDTLQTIPLKWYTDPTELNGLYARSLGMEYKIMQINDGTWSVTTPNGWIVNISTQYDAKAAADKDFAKQVTAVIVTGQ